MAWMYSDSWQGQNEEFMTNNAWEAYNYFIQYGYTVNAIAGMLGNMQTESAINPHQKEFVQGNWTPQNGYGLCGWTPATNLMDYSPNNYTDGNIQCEYIDLNAVGTSLYAHWKPNPWAPELSGLPETPPVDWIGYGASELPPETLAEYFMYYYEHPAKQSIIDTKDERRSQARHWYDVLGGNPPTPSRRKSMPIYMMIKKFI